MKRIQILSRWMIPLLLLCTILPANINNWNGLAASNIINAPLNVIPGDDRNNTDEYKTTCANCHPFH